jgi:hypothetical protein
MKGKSPEQTEVLKIPAARSTPVSQDFARQKMQAARQLKGKN